MINLPSPHGKCCRRELISYLVHWQGQKRKCEEVGIPPCFRILLVVSNRNKEKRDLLAQATLKFKEMVSDITGSKRETGHKSIFFVSPSLSSTFLYIDFNFRQSHSHGIKNGHQQLQGHTILACGWQSSEPLAPPFRWQNPRDDSIPDPVARGYSHV